MFTSTPGRYVLLVNRIGSTLNSTTQPCASNATIGNDSNTAQMNAKFDQDFPRARVQKLGYCTPP
jgi:hypothetical protein